MFFLTIEFHRLHAIWGSLHVEISLDGRDSAHVFINDNGLFSRLKLDLKKEHTFMR